MPRKYTPESYRLPRHAPHTPEWHAARREGIGGSDASVIVGLNRWKSPLELWVEKTTDTPHDDTATSDAAYWGTVLEPVVREELARRLRALYPDDIHVQPSPGALANIERPWIRCNPDGILTRKGLRTAIVEIKTVGSRGAHEWAGDPDDLDGEVAAHAYIQCLHSMMVTGYRTCWVGVLIAGQTFKWRRVEWHPANAAALLAAETEFWARVQDRTPPDPDGTPSAGLALRRLYATPDPDSDGVDIDHAAADVEAYRRLSQAIGEGEAELEVVRQRLQAVLGAHEIGRVGGRPAVTWRAVETARVDTKALRAEHPEVAAAHTVKSTARRFTVTTN